MKRRTPCPICLEKGDGAAGYCPKCGVLYESPAPKVRNKRGGEKRGFVSAVILLLLLLLGGAGGYLLVVGATSGDSAPSNTAEPILKPKQMSFHVLTTTGKVHRFNCWLTRKSNPEKLEPYVSIEEVREAGFDNDCGFCRPGAPLPETLAGFEYGAQVATKTIHTSLCYYIYRSTDELVGYSSVEAGVADGYTECTLCIDIPATSTE